MSPLRGGAAVLAEDGAEQAKFLAHREAMGVFLEHLLLTKVEKLSCHIHMLPSIDYMRRHHSLPC